MVTLPIRYPLDPTGVSPDNKVVGEIHSLPARKVRAIAPGYGSFFAESVVVRDSATGQTLTKNVQYTCTELLAFPTGRYGKEVDGIILIKDQSVSSQVEIDYQTLGGMYSTNSDAIIQMLNSAEMDNRPVAWGDIIGIPDAFTPAKHYHDIGDIYGFEYVVHAIERVRAAILIGDDASHDQIYRYIDASFTQVNTRVTGVQTGLNAHISDFNNPHQTTKTQVGLGAVDNFATATTAQAQTGTATNVFMTPALTAAAINSQAGAALAQHINDHSNPHQTTKAQVGLSLVDNFGTATQVQAEAGTDTATFMTPLRVAQAITKQAGALLTTHINDHNNPHQVTQAQVGLGAVNNAGFASTSQAQAGTDSFSYMTPLATAQAITAQIGTLFNAHVANVSNPHQVTAVQVGLGNVSNFTTASDADAQAATRTDRFMTPRGTALAINNLGAALVNAHASRTDNPHQTTAAQVGLGNVSNYPIASDGQALDPNQTTSYTTPHSVWVALGTHTGRTDNPHQTTAAQVGLGNVSNYATASDGDAQAATRADCFMTPRGTALAINNLGTALVNTHATRTDNPHQTTAAQVGLGNVPNYTMASDAQATDVNITSVFMSPHATYLEILAYAITPLNNHVGNFNNPHQTTAAQIGLGNVQNFGVSSNAQATDVNNASVYMTPSSTYAAISAYAISPLNNHIGNLNNPHQTTAAQVGLSNVPNYGMANDTQATDSNFNTAFMSPRATYLSIAGYAITPLNSHIGNFNNPHQTTKTQVGLGAVDNFATATSQMAVDGTATDRFVTPAGLKAAINSATSNLTNAQSTWAAVQTFNSRNASVGSFNGSADYSGTVFQSTGGSASISFLRPNAYGINFGLDADNVIRLGGWSNGTNIYRMQIDTSGNATFPGNVSAYSDRSLKKDVEIISSPLERIGRLEGVTFTRIDNDERQTGLIAQDVQKVLPEAVQKMSDGILTLAYGNLAGLFVEGFKALINEINDLKTELILLKDAK